MRARNLLAGLLLAMSATRALAQGGAYGTILGTVTDNSGAVVANAGIEVTNIATNVSKRTETTSTGDYTVPYLPPSIYRVTVQATGFQRSVVDHIGLFIGQDVLANVKI